MMSGQQGASGNGQPGKLKSESPDEFTLDELSLAVASKVRELVLPSVVGPQECPCAILLGGQSGAGKTLLHAIFRERLQRNVIVINGDEYRKLHPRFDELDAVYGADSVSHTAAWSGKMTEALIDALSSAKYNLIIEGTLRTSKVPMRTAELLCSRGYSVSLALMAVKPEISLVSCKLRFEQMRLAGTTPRATDPAHHNKIVRDIVDNLAVLESSGLFDQVFLYDRAGACLYPAESQSSETRDAESQPVASQDGDERTADVPASEVLRQKLFGAWTGAEKSHFAALEEQLNRILEK